MCNWYVGLTCSPLWLKEIQSSFFADVLIERGLSGLRREIFGWFAHCLDEKQRIEKNYFLAVCLVGITGHLEITNLPLLPSNPGPQSIVN